VIEEIATGRKAERIIAWDVRAYDTFEMKEFHRK